MTKFLSALILISALIFGPAGIGAQCNIANTSFTMVGASTNAVVKTLTTSALCSLTMSNNVGTCFPSAALTTSMLSASANPADTNPSCAWNCACGAVVIDGSDGLPVELMSVSVE